MLLSWVFDWDDLRSNKARMSYPGSKAQEGVWQRIIGQMPPHSIYVELFAGSAQVFRRKRWASTVLVDIDLDVCKRLREDFPEINPSTGEPQNAPEIWCMDWQRYFRRAPFLSSNTLIYADPPYPLSTRNNRRYYRHEFTDEQHAELLNLLKSIGCCVLLSGYHCKLYDEALRDWRCISYRTRAHRKTVTECLWANFPEPEILHDSRFAGRTFRERFSWGRFTRRWMARVEAMPLRKQQFILEELANAIAQRHRWLATQGDRTRRQTPRAALPSASR